MQNNQGFTLIEVIFTISVIIILSFFTLHYAISSPPQLSFNQQCNKIISFLEEVKTKALLNHKRIDILIESARISYDFQGIVFLELDQNYYFENSFELYFNKNGNINSANHLDVCNRETCKSIIFNLGSGVFYVKE